MYNKEEVKILKKYYPLLGMKVQQFLPNRTTASIDHEVRSLGIKVGLFEDGEEGFLDIETTNLNADFAFMLTYCIKTKGKEEYRWNRITKEEISSGILDKRLVTDLVEDLRKYKKVYTYYGARFDIPFIRTRALAHELEFIPYGLIFHQDLYFLAKSKLRLSRRRLANVCDLLGVDGKTHLDGKLWMLAATGNEEAIDYIYNHNKSDVEILERAYNKLKIYASVTRTSI
jgi:uncharacterized protein YprB with RNaseH-like and TPR domain